MKRTELRRSAPLLPCGPRYASREKAAESGRGEPYECPDRRRCGGWHVRKAEEPGRLVLPVRPRRRDTGPDARTRKLVLERDSYRCVCCGISIIGRPYSLQHRKRRSQGGTNSPSNLVVVLGLGGDLCHGRIDYRRDPDDEAKGYSLRSWQDPAQAPVWVASGDGSGALVWLTADGGYAAIPPAGEAA